MKYLFFILAFIISFFAKAQNITISAHIQDKETGQALTYASVGIKGIPIGTISNQQGEFDFHFPASYRNEILVVSMLGYKNFEAPIWSLIDSQVKTIQLEKSSIFLQEIVVTDTLTGGEILQIALSRIENNYPMMPFLLDGFYRDIKKVGGTYISLLEAAVQIYDESYAAPRNKYRLRENVKLIEVRKSLGYESKFTTYFDQTNLLEDLLLENPVRYRHINEDDELFEKVKREPGSYYDDHEIYVVTFASDHKLRVFIDKVDFSIVHFEFESSVSSEEIKRKKGMVSKFIGSTKTIDFRRYQGKMYPSFMTMTTKVNWYDINNGALKFETELIQQLLINKVTPDTKVRIGSTEKMRNYGLQYQDLPYNKVFWDNYNVIKDTPLDNKILDDLEKIAPLHEQFEDN